MLASIIANLQNVPQPEVARRPPMIKIDRGGGGGPSWPNYDIVDIMTAVRLFPEIADENPVARAVRRRMWIGEALPHIKEARERREASAFLAGAVVADAAAEERHRLIDQLRVEQLVEIIDEVRGIVDQSARSRADVARGARDDKYERGGAGFVAAALAIGVIGAVALIGRRSR